MKRNIKNIKNLSLGFGLPKLFDTQESTIQLPKHQKTKTKSEKKWRANRLQAVASSCCWLPLHFTSPTAAHVGMTHCIDMTTSYGAIAELALEAETPVPRPRP
jgi:hypothetical protein